MDILNILFFTAVLLPAIIGILFVGISFVEHVKITKRTGGQVNIPKENRTIIHLIVSLVLIGCTIAILYFMWGGVEDRNYIFFYFMKGVPIYFHIDALGRYFATFVTLMWTMIAVYSITYMKHEGEELRFFGFYMILYTVLVLLDFAGNLITFYFFYELMSLTSMPLVFHNGSKKSIMAALRYLFYSICGAYMGLFGIFFLYHYCNTMTFSYGGTLGVAASYHKGIVLFAIFLLIMGFGAKAGLFPLHSWLPAAHPVAPSSASAVLSGIIVKSGILAIIRTVYYIVGPDFIRGTWVQYVWMGVTLLTIFMGSMMAFLEPVLKKRLAYSSVSQLSYIMFGLALLSPTGFIGALMHIFYHAVIKCGLFLCAGTFLFYGLYHHDVSVKALRGVGKRAPIVLWCWTFFALSLVGIPPFSGFMSKWYLAEGALGAQGVGIFAYIGPLVLLLSAFLTAGYLIPITIRGFLPGEDYKIDHLPEVKISGHIQVPLIILAAITLILGLFPNTIIHFLAAIATNVF